MEAPRIHAVTIEGHTSIAVATVELGSVNVLVGANGSGKSNFIRALELLGRVADDDLAIYVELAGGASALAHQHHPRRAAMIRFEVDAGEYAYRCTLRATADDRLVFDDEQYREPGGAGVGVRGWVLVGRGHRVSHLREATGEGSLVGERVLSLLRGVQVYHFSDTGPDAPVKQPGPTADNLALRPDAGNLAAVLALLQQAHPQSYQRIVESVRLAAPFFGDFILRPEGDTDRIRLRWRHVDSPRVFSAHQMSDGTLRFICLATLLLQPDLPHLVALDEPELGLHPYAIVLLAELLHAVRDRSQVVLATQSVTLIDQFSLADIIVVEREAGASTFHRPDEATLRDWLDEYSLGELWQKNLIGGRPRREMA